MGFLHFLQYHNAVPIALGVLFLGAGSIFAATNPETIYDTTDTVVSVDNTYIATKDLSTYTPSLQIINVTEDDDSYYVEYVLTTIDVVDSVWQDVDKNTTLTVDKKVLGEYGDLGLYVTEQLKQIVDHQIAYLREVQDIERKLVTNKVVATAYSGLVGALLDTTTERIPGYVPVVTPPVPAPEVSSSDSSGSSSAPASASTSGTLTIQLLGDALTRVPLSGEYRDLGVVVSGDTNPTVKAYLNDSEKELGQIVIDTTFARTWHIRYVASDADGLTATVERTVEIYDPMVSPAPVEPTPPAPATTTPATSTSATTTPSIVAPEEPEVVAPTATSSETTSATTEE